jgi:CHAD domain-containing protein
MVTRMRRAAATALASSEDEQARHRLRRRARRLRYALEWLGQPANELIALQEALGRSNDAAVALAHASAHCPQDQALLTGLQREAAGDRSHLKELLEAVERTLEDEG